MLGKGMRVKIVRVRKEHTCGACNEIIKKGEKAFVRIVLFPIYQRYHDRIYYHYDNSISKDEFKDMTPNEIRKKICSKRDLDSRSN